MKCDLHIHSSYSYDSSFKPKKIVQIALAKGIDCLAITDHETVEGAIETQKLAQGLPILIIPGIEVKSEKGDILGLNVKKNIPDGLSVKETIKRIKQAGGLAVIAHPFGWLCSFKEDLKKLINEIDAIEVFNAAIFGPGNKKAAVLAEQYGLAKTCGSDAHCPNSLGKAYLEIPGKNLSIEEVLEKIKNKEGKVSGQGSSFFEKTTEHLNRNLAKLKNKTIC